MKKDTLKFIPIVIACIGLWFATSSFTGSNVNNVNSWATIGTYPIDLKKTNNILTINANQTYNEIELRSNGMSFKVNAIVVTFKDGTSQTISINYTFGPGKQKISKNIISKKIQKINVRVTRKNVNSKPNLMIRGK